ncbi:MAG: PilZ domain-containing protein [Planctomycetaceae bacterium]
MKSEGKDGATPPSKVEAPRGADVAAEADRRRHRRFLEEVTVRYRDIEGSEPSRWARTRDLSLGGTCLVISEPLAVGSHLVIEVHIEHEAAPLLVLARVLRSVPEEDGFAAGLEFLWLGEEDRVSLRRLSEHFRRRHGETGELQRPG